MQNQSIFVLSCGFPHSPCLQGHVVADNVTPLCVRDRFLGVSVRRDSKDTCCFGWKWARRKVWAALCERATVWFYFKDTLDIWHAGLSNKTWANAMELNNKVQSVMQKYHWGHMVWPAAVESGWQYQADSAHMSGLLSVGGLCKLSIFFLLYG